MLEARLLRSIVVPTLRQRSDRELVRERDRLVRRRRAVMVQIRAFLLTYGIEAPVTSAGTKVIEVWLSQLTLADRLLDSLRRGYLEADRHLEEHTGLLKSLARTRRHAPRVALLTSVPGLGWLPRP